MGVSDILYFFFARGRGRGVVEAPEGGGGSFFYGKAQKGGGLQDGRGRYLQRIREFGGGG